MTSPRTLRLTLAYDGTPYHGWQRQVVEPTVQQTVEDVLRRLLRHPLEVVGASRTDAGVHARGQVAHVRTRSDIPLSNIRRALSDRLPETIALVHAEEAPPEFDAISDARGKLYRYTIHNADAPPAMHQQFGRTWHVWYRLDVDRLRDAATRLIGTHDFAGFASQGAARKTTIRTIRRAQVACRYHSIQIDFEGDGFLYNQVRNMIGTLIEIGRGHWPVQRIDQIIAACDRRLAGPTAPACGLCLQWVRYR
ncbi:tRNA pseudouridine synthase A [Phycisphaerae bacterium RAS1]|nr:tRNA pseudouridine synthase A [Phycisphaerae bacterium RAS1]